MPKWTVRLTARAPLEAIVEVEAEDQNKARVLAETGKINWFRRGARDLDAGPIIPGTIEQLAANTKEDAHMVALAQEALDTTHDPEAANNGC